MMRKISAAVALGVLLATSACGGGSSRPTQDELSKALQKGGTSVLGDSGTKVSRKSADCVAKVLEDSRISDRALRAIVEGRKTYSPSRADQSAAIGVASKIVKCLPAGLK
ncbi:MAG: hypothetical protein ACJ72D_18870 [Marmoricola sp.]